MTDRLTITTIYTPKLGIGDRERIERAFVERFETWTKHTILVRETTVGLEIVIDFQDWMDFPRDVDRIKQFIIERFGQESLYIVAERTMDVGGLTERRITEELLGVKPRPVEITPCIFNAESMNTLQVIDRFIGLIGYQHYEMVTTSKHFDRIVGRLVARATC